MKIISAQEAAALVKDGNSVMAGGFLACGSAHSVFAALAKQGTKNLTLIGNDTAFEGVSYGQLVVNKQVKKIIATHVGTNKETGRQRESGETEVLLVPQGTLAERIRAGGWGLGGILTPTGLGTIVAEGKQVIEVKGKSYLLEEALRADIAILYATKADKYGNLAYDGTTRNFNQVMAMAADTVIVEVEEMVDVIEPNSVITPGVVVDYIVKKE